MGYSKYPNQLDDSTTLPPAVDLVTPVKAEAVNRLRDAILAIEAELGAQPSGAYGAVKARLDAMQAQVTTIGQDLDAVEAELGVNPSGTFNTVAGRLASITNNVTQLLIDVAQLIIDVNAIETELGVNPSGIFSTAVLRLDDIDTQLTALNVSREVVTPILSGSEDTNSSTFVAKGGGILNPTSLGHPSVTFTLEVLLQTTNASFDGYFELFNITEGVAVTHDIFQVSATTPTLFTSTLTAGGVDLPASQVNILEGRIRLETGAPASDRVICKYAAIRSKPN